MSKTNVKPELKSVSGLELKAAGEGIIEAYAAAFGNVDSYGDVIQKGAFLKTTRERKDQIKVLYNHDHYTHLPVGKPISMIEDNYGLATVTKMANTQMGKDLYELAAAAMLDSMSIGFQAVKAEYPDTSVGLSNGVYRTLTEIKLFEYSFVPFPANEQAVIIGIKSEQDLTHEIERWAGVAQMNFSTKAGRVLSGQNAKRILAALTTLKEIVESAGLELEEEAAPSTSDTEDQPTGTQEKSTEPPKHSLLLALQLEAKRLDSEATKGALLKQLRAFAADTGVNQA